MGKRSGVIDHEEGLAELTLAELDAEIARCQMRRQIETSSRNRKQWDSRIHWLESFREKHHSA
jgi:hypothetical protein